MGLLSLSYRRPQHVNNDELRPESRASTGSDASQASSEDMKGEKRSTSSVRSGQSGRISGIPEALSFERIIDGGTCPPCTIRDFMNYLIYIERAAENLQFFLWYRDYAKRFESASTTDVALAPEWTPEKADEVAAKLQKEHVEKLRRDPQGEATAIFKGTDFEKTGGGASTIAGGDGSAVGGTSAPDKRMSGFDFGEGVAAAGGSSAGTPSQVGDGASTMVSDSIATTYKATAQDAFAQAGAKQPFTIQPFREEIDRVIATYITEDSPRQLNLSSRERTALLQALAYTTHPTAFRGVLRTVEHSLRRQAHPNFIRWSICNGNPARVFFARALGTSLIVMGITAALVLTLSSVPRGYRALGAIGWVLGISTLVAAYKGMCVVLHGMHHRHIRPWELFETDEQDVAATEDGGVARGKTSFDSFGSSNSYEDEPWVVKYSKRNIIRKIFDREVWIQEPALRQIQDTIFVQAMLTALVLSGILVVIFVLVPGGNFF